MENNSNNQIAIQGNAIYGAKLQSLEEQTLSPVDLNTEYWTPSQVGETRRMYFTEIRYETTTDQQSGQEIELSVAYFIEVLDGVNYIVRNASKRLVGVIETFKIEAGTPLQIEYKGKIKNKNNGNMSDSWSIRPLTIK